jgi:hypothetical protein
LLHKLYRPLPGVISGREEVFWRRSHVACYRSAIPSPEWGTRPYANTFVEQETRFGLVYTALAHPLPMHKFNYRAPRFSVDFPVQLALDETTIAGRCTEISTDGMQLELRRALPPDFCGVVCLSWQNVYLELQVRLAHTGSRQDALRFIFNSEKERAAVVDLVARLADPAEPVGEPGLVLVR